MGEGDEMAASGEQKEIFTSLQEINDDDEDCELSVNLSPRQDKLLPMSSL